MNENEDIILIRTQTDKNTKTPVKKRLLKLGKKPEADYLIIETNGTEEANTWFETHKYWTFETFADQPNVYKIYPEGQERSYDRKTDWSGLLAGNKYIKKILKTKAEHVTSMYELVDSSSIVYLNIDMPKVKNIKYICYGCKNLEEAHIHNAKSLEDAAFAFMYCENLKIFTGLDDAALCSDYYKTFAYNYALESPISINTDSATDMRMAFYWNHRVPSIQLTDTSKVKDFADAFCRCWSVKEISDIDLRSCTTLKYTFFSCYYLQNINIINLNKEKLTDAESAFYGCQSFQPDLVRKLREMFLSLELADDKLIGLLFNCARFTDETVLYEVEYELGGWKGGKIIIIGSLSEKNKNWPSGVPNYRTMTYVRVFSDGSDLQTKTAGNDTYLIFPPNQTSWNDLFNVVGCVGEFAVISADATGVTSIERMFKNCENLKYVNFTNSSEINEAGEAFANCTSLTQVNFDSTAKLLRTESMFAKCSSLKSITLDASHIGYANGMFSDCTSLKNVSLPGLGKNGDDLTGMFYGCKSLTTINLETDSATSLSNLFWNCESLETAFLTSTKNATDMSGMFYSCTSLKYVPDLDIVKCTNMENMFNFCRSLGVKPNQPWTDFVSGVRFSGAFELYRRALSTGKVKSFSNCFNQCITKGQETFDMYLIPTSWGGLNDFADGFILLEVMDSDEARKSITSNTKIIAHDTLEANQYVVYCKSSTNKSWDHLFEGNEYITNILACNGTGIKSMKKTFKGCSRLKCANLAYLQDCIDMSYMFENCSSLTSIWLSDEGNCENMTYMFSGCSKLSTIILEHLDKVKDMSYMFNACTALKSAKLLHAGKVETLYAQFLNAGSSEGLKVFYDDLSSCENMSFMFSGSGAVHISLPPIKAKCNLESFAQNATHLKGFQLSTNTVINLSNAFAQCQDLENAGCLNFSSCSDLSEIFAGSTKINHVALRNLRLPISIADFSSNLSEQDLTEIIKYLESTSTGTTFEVSKATYNTMTVEQKEMLTKKRWTLTYKES